MLTLNRLELFKGIVPELAVMQQNLKQHLVKVWLDCRVTSQADLFDPGDHLIVG